ncbi:MAG: OmpA family protein [Wenzhouxiangella sp.]
MKLSMLAVAMGAAAMMSQSVEAETDFDDRWYLAPAVGVVRPHSDRLGDDGPYYGLSFGRFFTPQFSIDLRLDRYKSEFDQQTPNNSETIRLNSYGLVGRYHLDVGSAATRPYLMAAAGIQEHASFAHDGRDIYGSLGAGVAHRLNDRLSLRAELEGRYDNDRDTFNRSRGFIDVIGSVALNFRLGDLPPPPPPPAEPAPPPPPPPPAPEPEPEPEVIFEFDATVTFELDSADLKAEAVAELNEAAALLNLHDELVRIEVAGHTCDLGPETYNQGLSERRAQAVRDYLVNEGGVDADRLVVRGYGEDRPKVANSSTENRQRNRRVELVVIERSDD